jgi:hypothetical protein
MAIYLKTYSEEIVNALLIQATFKQKLLQEQIY